MNARYRIRVNWVPDISTWDVTANSEEEAIEKFRERYERELLREIRYIAELLED